MNFSSENDVIWCILGVLFLRFMCPMDCSCMINFRPIDENDSDLQYSEVPLKGKNKTLVKILGDREHRTTPAGQILGGRDACNPCGVDACAFAAQTTCIFTPSLVRKAEYRDVRVCLCVFLSVCVCFSPQHISDLYQIFVRVTYGCGSILLRRR